MPALEGLGRALGLLRRRRGWSAAEGARRTGIDQSNLGKYERDAKGITAATLERILDGYEATLAELAEVLKEVQGGQGVRWVVPGKVTEEDLELVVRRVLGGDWVPPDEPVAELGQAEGEASEGEEKGKDGEDLPNGDQDDG